ncbi:MAG: hypothetical protein ACOYEV_14895 [Candidatus Nanopelagicales bacterium]
MRRKAVLLPGAVLAALGVVNATAYTASNTFPAADAMRADHRSVTVDGNGVLSAAHFTMGSGEALVQADFTAVGDRSGSAGFASFVKVGEGAPQGCLTALGSGTTTIACPVSGDPQPTMEDARSVVWVVRHCDFGTVEVGMDADLLTLNGFTVTTTANPAGCAGAALYFKVVVHALGLHTFYLRLPVAETPGQVRFRFGPQQDHPIYTGFPLAGHIATRPSLTVLPDLYQVTQEVSALEPVSM